MDNQWGAIDTETEEGKAALVGLTVRAAAGVPQLGPAPGLDTWVVEIGRHIPARGWPTLEALAQQMAEEAPQFWAWNLTYDAQALLRFLPREDLNALAVTGRARRGEFLIEYRPGKRLRLGPVRIFDLQPFLGGSLDGAAKKFLDAAKAKLPPEIHALLVSGRMGTAHKLYPSVVEEYLSQDVALTYRLWNEVLRPAAEELKLDFSNPTSPAGVARRFWKEREIVPGHVGRGALGPAWKSFHGGRIEVTRRGLIRNAARWDIHSAYPSAMVGKPLLGACTRLTLRRGEIPRPDAAYAVLRVRWTLPGGEPTYPVPYWYGGGAGDGILVYPRGRWESWADLPTYNVVVAAYGERAAQIQSGFQWIQTSPSNPWAPMLELYASRTDPRLKLAVKLVMNSTYGLLAEQNRVMVPAHGRPTYGEMRFAGGRAYVPKMRMGGMACPVLAAAITGEIRARLWEEWRGQEVYSFMTDGVIAHPRAQPPADTIGSGMGQWGKEGEGPALIIGSGVYAVQDDDGQWSEKTRGYHSLKLRVQLERDKRRTYIYQEGLAALSLGECMERNIPFTDMNFLRPTLRPMDLNFDVKRKWARVARAGDLLRRSQGSEPLFAWE